MALLCLMWKVLLWQGSGLIALLCSCEKCYYDTVIIKQQFISTFLLWQKITQLQDKAIKPHPYHNNIFYNRLIELLSHVPYRNYYWSVNYLFFLIIKLDNIFLANFIAG
jgi:hypothetical protein